MIIDCHGHYTTAPKELQKYRDAQVAALKDAKHVPSKGTLAIERTHAQRLIARRYAVDELFDEITGAME